MRRTVTFYSKLCSSQTNPDRRQRRGLPELGPEGIAGWGGGLKVGRKEGLPKPGAMGRGWQSAKKASSEWEIKKLKECKWLKGQRYLISGW